MPQARLPLFGLRASGTLGGHRRGQRRRLFAAETAAFLPTIDTFIDGLQPDANYGAHVWLKVGLDYTGEDKSLWGRGLLNFDASSLAGKTVLSAHLNVLIVSRAGAPFDVWLARNTRPSTWTEGGSTWTCYASPLTWTAAGGDHDISTPAQVPYTVPAADNWQTVPNLGPHVSDALSLRAGLVALHLRCQDEAPAEDNQWWFYSRSNPILSPQLVVEYE